MSDYQHRARKRFGQNFLHDAGVIHRILRAIHAKPGERLVEIGPGQGALTEGLLDSGAQLDVVELDLDLIPILQAKFAGRENFNLNQGDALKFDFSRLSQEPASLRIVGNLPYNISTPLIFHLLEHAQLIRDMHFMLQKEVVERLAAQPGGGDWGRLSIMVQYHCRVEHLFNVGPGAFNPAPKVDSAIVRLVPHETLPHPARDHRQLERVVREAFNQRRKTLRNTLKGLLDAEAIEAAGVDGSLRPEQLDLAAFVRLSDQLTERSYGIRPGASRELTMTEDPRYRIDVSVTPRYLAAQSEPEQNRYAFAYTVTIENKGEVAAQLLSRHWIITDGDGHVQEVRGAGVIGEQPLIAPGEHHVYTSGTLLPTCVGSMQGSYQMVAEDGHSFDAVIAPFRLAVPGALH